MKGFDKDDGSKLVDEYTRLKNAITKAQTQLDSIEESLVAFAKEQGIDVVYGSDQKISIKEYEKITITDKEGLITFLKEKGLYEKFIQLSTMKIQASVKNKELDAEQFVSHEKGIRISVRSKKEEDNA